MILTADISRSNYGFLRYSMARVAKLFDPRDEFAIAKQLEGRKQCDLRNLCKNSLLQYIVVQ